MGRYDVYANPEPSERKQVPYLLDVQNDHIDHLASRVVIPLRQEADFGPRAQGLNPMVTVGGHRVVLDTAALAAVPLAELRKVVDNLAAERAAIQDALDTLFGAY